MEDTGKSCPLIVILLILAAVLVDLLFAVDWARGESFPHLPAVVLLGLALAQVGLLSAWLAFGGGPLLLRFGVTFVAVGLLSLPAASTTLPSFPEWLGVFSLYAAMVAIPLSLVRLSGSRLTIRTPNASRQGESRLRRWQFSLGDLLALMTVTAVASALARLFEFPQAHAVLVAACCIGFACVTLLSMWSASDRRNWLAQAAVLVLLCPAIGAALGRLSGPPAYCWPFAIMTFVQAGLVFLSVGILRVAGLQFGPLDEAGGRRPKEAMRFRRKPARLG